MKRFKGKRHYKFASIILIIIIDLQILGQPDSVKYPPNSSQIIPVINFKDTDIRDVLRSIAFEYQTNIVVDNQLNQKISIALFKTKLSDALKIISEDNNLDFSFDTRRFFVRQKKEKQTTPPPAPQEPEPQIFYNNGRISISLNNADIQKVVNKLREKTRKNFLITAGTSGRLTGTLDNIDMEIGLRNLLQNNGYYMTLKDSIYYISRSSYYSSMENAPNTNKKNPYWISAKNNKVTIDVNQISIDRILDDLSNQLSLQIIKLNVPSVDATLKCYETNLDKVMEYLFKGTEFTFRKDGNAYIIGSKSSKNLDNSKLIKVQYLRADKLKEILPPSFTQTLTVNVSLEHNALIVTGQNESISNFENYIKTVDQPVPQVMIEALVVDYNLDKQFQFGINAGKGDSTYLSRANKYYPGVDATISGRRLNEFLEKTGTIKLFGSDINIAKLGKLPEDFYLNLKALQQDGIANVRSKPILSSLNGHTASLKIGTVQNYVFNEIMPVTNQLSSTFLERERIEKIEANISFEITPWIGPNNELTLEIKPEFQTPIGPFVPDKKLIPAINTRSFFSTVRLKDGETIILGGLIQETESNTEEKFPILGDIPFIGSLFSNVDKKKIKGELVVYLTPKIYYGDELSYSYYNFSK
jgi:type IV pilus assembly protein PilQ